MKIDHTRTCEFEKPASTRTTRECAIRTVRVLAQPQAYGSRLPFWSREDPRTVPFSPHFVIYCKKPIRMVKGCDDGSLGTVIAGSSKGEEGSDAGRGMVCQRSRRVVEPGGAVVGGEERGQRRGSGEESEQEGDREEDESREEEVWEERGFVRGGVAKVV
ncbi:hypothetical protein BD410DRAFT_801988 [Rickenella mellea]|uniref:Uncharacterized protein n=1 Tax=Rickenella mellea TaxID=50990 RepID=A0A4Y7QBB8_9AGAM|nr:hypothetical protein BD410DRAFT_801988 [Rickenella mellea]